MSRILIPLLALALAGSASADVRVVSSIGSLGAIAREVVGKQGKVTVLAPAHQDPHFVDGKPTMMLELNQADVLLQAGLGLEVGWLPTLVTGARNGKIQPGRPGNIDASAFVGPLLDSDAKLDRSLGDVHPGGNPHYWLDPRRAKRIATGLAERLASLDPENAAAYRANAAAFGAALDPKIAEWEKAMAPFRGRAIVPYHKSLAYLEDWLGLKEVATVEPLPGISPSPSHLAGVIMQLRQTKPPAVVAAEPWYNLRTAETVAEKGGATLVRLPGDVGSVPGKDSYIAHLDELISRLRAGLEGR
ncbi:metal ABC transporter substrate-binding protein [Vulgatibacter incomptus]|uniref:Zinc ABC transporter, periplasmic-binding protein ZnuA n=1 Tax=Vulgatibacter incomptus TaxID=1391653 RepID=A0A0K1PEC7_9BACT|nr:metal ABC transporter substrate-binding protein [Vulgatibacter incomptus]AKU91484.1 Zinc ABC transporter, periplasmic-binding protein ZnuA [Vulgatibacter incomptus]